MTLDWLKRKLTTRAAELKEREGKLLEQVRAAEKTMVERRNELLRLTLAQKVKDGGNDG